MKNHKGEAVSVSYALINALGADEFCHDIHRYRWGWADSHVHHRALAGLIQPLVFLAIVSDSTAITMQQPCLILFNFNRGPWPVKRKTTRQWQWDSSAQAGTTTPRCTCIYIIPVFIWFWLRAYRRKLFPTRSPLYDKGYPIFGVSVHGR